MEHTPRGRWCKLSEELELSGGYNAWIRLARDSSDYLFGRLARTRFVSGIASESDGACASPATVSAPFTLRE
jgi:hypothetical protein